MTKSAPSGTTRPSFSAGGAILDGNPQPFVLGSGEVTAPLYTSIILSIANLRVFHDALLTGSESTKKFGLDIFNNSVLQQLEAVPNAVWMAPFWLFTPAMPGNPSAR